MKKHIRLRGINGAVEGMVWESDCMLRVGRLASLEIVLDDSSVSRRHAEIRTTVDGWRVRDLGSANGTNLNGNRLAPGEWPICVNDVLRFGNVTVVVDALGDGSDDHSGKETENFLVSATTSTSYEDALRGLAFDRNRCPRPGEQLKALLRVGHHMVHLENEEDLLHTILNDAVSTLEAQRGAIVLADDKGVLHFRVLASGHSQVPSRPGYSQSLAQRSFSRGESILCRSVVEDPELTGAMASVVCVVLRTPRKRLGVLYLNRGPLQKPFTKEELHLADALAANVSACIESAQLLRKQRDLFCDSITILAESVELRDKYTGSHTQRVTRYAVLLAEYLDLPAPDLNWVRYGTPLHDIGKIGIPDEILCKPGKLTPQEWEIMKTHTTKGAKIIEAVPDLAPVLPIVRSHHERWDGQGYPDGLRGTNIPVLARLVAVPNAFDNMTSNVPYRAALPVEVAFAEIEKNRGRQFDPDFAAAFISIRQRIIQEMQAETKQISISSPPTLLHT